jgi:hypothetical protein
MVWVLVRYYEQNFELDIGQHVAHVWVHHCESGGVRIGKPRPVVKIGMQGERRRDVVWTHVGVGSTARGQTPGISSIIEIGYDDRCKSEARREGEEE